jgi:hypothetical protein
MAVDHATPGSGAMHWPPRPLSAQGAPWLLYSLLFASTCVLVGVMWDISWHQTIGRDTFWSPPHLAIYLGGIVAGVSSGFVALHTTFAGAADARAASVRFWGFRAPLGAWVCIWGAIAMLTSAPFDDWWHNAYGLDVKILSPPHTLLALGIGAIQVGAMLMAVAWQNRIGRADRAATVFYLYAAGLLLLQAATMGTEYLGRWDMHQTLFYMVSCAVFPFFLVSAGRASAARWPATTATLVYTGLTLLMLWILPLFEGHPLLGPIRVQVERFVPPAFPLLLVVPALAIDLVMRRVGPGRDWRLAAALAATFAVVFAAVQWPFAEFLMTPWARNWVFATHHMSYMIPPAIQATWFQFKPAENIFAASPLILALAFVSARCGLWWGNWMSRVQR